MTNYDMDEMRRREKEKVERNLASADYDGALGQTDAVAPEWNARRSDEDMTEKRKAFAQDLIEHEKKSIHDTRIPGKDEEPWTAIDVEVPDEDFIKIAHAAHTRDITINKMVNIMLKKSIEKAEYKFEHDSEPQLLTESYNF